VDLDLYKHAPPLPVVLPDGTILKLHPLPPSTVERCIIDTRLELRALKLTDPISHAMVLARRVVEAATGRDLADELLLAELLALHQRWTRWQKRCDPILSGEATHMVGILRRRVNDDRAFILDGARAHGSRTAGDYFGCPQVDLTDGQVAYWQALANAYAEFHVSDKRKEPTKQWLQSDPRDG
jgi:hypothetical protein